MNTLTEDALVELSLEVLNPLEDYAADCHNASIQLVRSGVLGECRVARGMCPGVGSQHSWVVLGSDCYDLKATIVDPTLWSYDSAVGGIWVGTGLDRGHTPHGTGSIWEYGRPDYPQPGAEIIELTPEEPWSREAQEFLDILGPLDRRGWGVLANAPVEGWPAAEIIKAMWQNERIGALVPIDIVGMLTDLNPSGLYLPGDGS